jgi:hypothetical protein
MTKKLSRTQQWMLDHPDDVPCPRDPMSARSWRIKRGLQQAPEREVADRVQLAKYEAAMAEKRQREAAA